MKKHAFVFGCYLLSVAGFALATDNKAVIHFHADVESVGSLRDASKVEWGLLFTTDDLVIVKQNPVPNENRTVLINHPRYHGIDFLNKMATVRGIKNRTTKTFSIAPGTYDWLVLLDVEGDGIIDGYLGTLASHGPLSSHRFWAGNSYFIALDKAGTLSFKESGNLHARETTEIAKAVGLRPISYQPRSAVDELRLWVFPFSILKRLIVLRDGPAGVHGEVVLWWSSNASPNRLWVPPGWHCGKHVVKPLLRVCRVAFEGEPDWPQLLRDLERENVWRLPDGSTLIPQRPKDMIVDGVSLAVEVRRGGRTHAYTYSSPDDLPGPHARNASRILSLVWKFVDSLEKKDSVQRQTNRK